MHVKSGRQNGTSASETKIFDPRDSSTDSRGDELLDPSLAKRGEQWCLYLASQQHGHGATDIYSAALAPGTPLSPNGWTPTRDVSGQLIPVAGRNLSFPWDGKGGRHCPTYAKGFDPHKRVWVERIYYAGAAENLWGPYKIGFLEWDGGKWLDQSEPAFVPTEDWEHGSV